MNIEKKYIVNPLIVLREEFDDWAVLFDPDTGNAHGLDPTGVFIWKQIDGKHDIDEIVKGLHDNFDEVPDDAKKEVETFISGLEEKGYITYAQ